MGKPEKLQKFLITNSPEIARYGDDSGVDYIFVDLEFIGKTDRQKNQNTPINNHTVADAAKVKKALKRAKLLTRLNPHHAGSRDEILGAIDAGTDLFWLPYFSTPEEVAKQLDLINRRARVSLLFETPASLMRFNSFLDRLEFDEAHFGLNDLKILSGLNFLFEPVAGGALEAPCAELKRRAIPFGIGGIGAVGLAKNALIHPEMILKEYARLGSTRVILSRAMTGNAKTVAELSAAIDLKAEIEKIDALFAQAQSRTPAEIERDRIQFRNLVYEVAANPR
jgi:hypothetical protein